LTINRANEFSGNFTGALLAPLVESLSSNSGSVTSPEKWLPSISVML